MNEITFILKDTQPIRHADIIEVSPTKKILFFPPSSHFYNILLEAACSQVRYKTLDFAQNGFLKLCKEYIQDKYPGWSLVHFEEIQPKDRSKHPSGLYLVIENIDANLTQVNGDTTKQISSGRL